MRSLAVISIIVILFTGLQFPQERLTGNLKLDSKIAFKETEYSVPQFTYTEKSKKSPILAGIFSLLVPGSGEIYSEEYLKAGIFLVVEATLITTAVVYDNKGNDKTTEFQGYADEEWSVVKYAEWLNLYHDASISIDPNSSLPPWERVNWTELNEAEKDFSHKLPPYGEQQYYELIGKYNQYSPGWNQFDPADDDYHHTPAQLFYYADMRGEANDYYNVASKAVIGVYVNHFLSALDAVWSAVSFNKDLAINVRVENIHFANIDELSPVLNLKYSF